MKQNYIWIKQGSSLHRIALESILFVCVIGHNCEVHTDQGVSWINISLIQLLKDLPSNFLTQVHRAYAVNMKQVTGMGRREVFIHRYRIPVAHNYVQELRDKFMKPG